MRNIFTAFMVVAAAVATSVVAQADDAPWAVNLGLWSKHWNLDADNETHNLIAGEYKGWTMGYMRNSEDEDSVLAGYHFHWPVTDWFTPGILIGAASGYDDGLGKAGVVPAGMLTGFFHVDGVGIQVNLLPWTSGVVAAGFRFEF